MPKKKKKNPQHKISSARDHRKNKSLKIIFNNVTKVQKTKQIELREFPNKLELL